MIGIGDTDDLTAQAQPTPGIEENLQDCGFSEDEWSKRAQGIRSMDQKLFLRTANLENEEAASRQTIVASIVGGLIFAVAIFLAFLM